MRKGERYERLEPRQLQRIWTTEGSSYGLPADLLATAVKRLGFLGLVIALMAPSAYLIEHFVQPERLARAGPVPFQQIVAAMLFAAGVSVFVMAWFRLLRPELTLDLGLVFEVVVAFAISLSENATPWPPGPIRGVSWNSLWITMYIVAIPGTYGKSVLAAFAAACMGPFGLLVATTVNGNPAPSKEQAAVLMLVPFVAAAWAIPVGRHLYRLGAQVNKARAMGSYELVELLGRGGMGEVWTARHRLLSRVSAIKVIRPEMLGMGNAESARLLLRRFEREARVTSTLRSPHTVVLYDYGISGDGGFYYVMELLDGLDLETLVRRFGPQPAARVTALLRQAAKSLAEAHEKGLVHRDIKPRNIFSCRMGTDYDFIKVLDFGLVKVRVGDNDRTLTGLTVDGVTTGTPTYIAPEVALGKADIDGRADLYSLACVGYWLLTGHLVFEGADAMSIALAHVQTPPVPPSHRTEIPVPRPLDDLILRCLEKDPARRVQTARELFAQLDVCRGPDSWTAEDAEHWWHMHMPREARPIEVLAATGSAGSGN